MIVLRALWSAIKGLLVEEGYAFVFSLEFWKALVVAIATYVISNAVAIQDWSDWRTVVAGLVTGAVVLVHNLFKSWRGKGPRVMRAKNLPRAGQLNPGQR